MAKNEIIFFTKEGRVSSATGFLSTNIITAGIDGSKLLDLRLIDTGSLTAITIKVNGVIIYSQVSPFNNNDKLMQNGPVDGKGNPYLNISPGAIVTMEPTGSCSVTAYVEDY
tara:strand:- start:18301 stop:18636 length:336 start_codon:yes stop_codon:yes gene_type:complete